MEMPESNNLIQIKVENDDDESIYMAANGTNGSSSSLTPSPTSSSNNSFSPYPSSVAAVASSTGQSVSSTQSYSGGGGSGGGGGNGQVVSSVGSPQSTTNSGGGPNGGQLNNNQGGGGGGGNGSYPPNHPLSGSKHLCSICGDRASGKHYGVYSCEGCKGFFKRTVRKDLSYVCREESNCIIDKKQRNRCQYCRYQKCLQMGMKREAVQEERQRTKEKNGEHGENGESMVESSTSSFSMVNSAAAAAAAAAVGVAASAVAAVHINPSTTSPGSATVASRMPNSHQNHSDISNSVTLSQNSLSHQHPNPILARNDSSSGGAISSLNQQLNQSPNFMTSYNHDLLLQQIYEAEKRIEIQIKQECMVMDLNVAVRQQVVQLFEWAKMIPHFADLTLEDQCSLIKEGWNELLIAEFAHRSIDANSVLVLGNGFFINELAAKSTGIGEIFQRVLTELVSKMREMHMDKTELGCLRAVVLFNPELKNLKCGNLVEQYRDKVYASLEEHCKSKYLNQPGRFAKLLLRLPALRSIGLKCVEHLFYKQLGNGGNLLAGGKKDSIDAYIRTHLDALMPNNNGRAGSLI